MLLLLLPENKFGDLGKLIFSGEVHEMHYSLVAFELEGNKNFLDVGKSLLIRKTAQYKENHSCPKAINPNGPKLICNLADPNLT